MRFHAQTAGVSLTAQQPEVNVVRTAVEALAAVLGGCQCLHTNSFDEAMALPTEAAATLALRTQQVLAHEVGVTTTADPLGGSWYVEALTDRLEREAYAIFERIDAARRRRRRDRRGLLPARARRLGFRHQQQVERGDRVIVGVNRTSRRDEPGRILLHVDPIVEQRQIDRLSAVRGAPRRRRRRGVARPPARRRRGRPQRHARARRVQRAYATLGRDVRRPARRLGRLPRDAGLLTRQPPIHRRVASA